MIPHQLTLKGFLSYLDETTLDLRPVDVACVSGANGAGKSSLFDAITWALFGKARRSDDALINDAADACMVAFEFEYENSDYRVLRQKTRDKGAVLEFQIRAEDGGWRVLTESGLRATEDRIRETLHLDYDTFINASFFLQDKADMFTQQNPSRRKEILSSILGLDIWESYREEAALRRRNASAEAKSARTMLDEIEQELSKEGERREVLRMLQDNLKKSEALRQNKEKEFAAARQKNLELRALQERKALIESQTSSARNRLKQTEAQIAERTAESENNQQLLVEADRIEADYQNWRGLQADLEKWNRLANAYHQLVNQRAEISARVSAEEARLSQEKESLLRDGDEIKENLLNLPALNDELIKLVKEQKEQEDQTARLPETETVLAGLQDKRAALQADNAVLKKRMNEIKERIHELESTEGSHCPLCGQDLDDTHRTEMTAQYEHEGTLLGDQFRANTQKMDEMDGQITALAEHISDLRGLLNAAGARQQSLGSLKEQIDSIQRRQDEWEKKGQPRLKELETMIEKGTILPQDQQKMLEMDDSIRALGYDEQAHQQITMNEAAFRQADEQHRLLITARAAQEGLKRELETLAQTRSAALEELSGHERLNAEMSEQIGEKEKDLPDLVLLESELDGLRLDENRIRQESGAARQMVDVLETQRKRHTDLSDQLEGMNRDIARLKVLEAAFSKDGVPALLIEQALPEIETQANLILDRLSDGRMSVNFETEREYKDKKREDKKQTLDILISDSSGRREYELFSGGEAFRINFAIRLALSRVLAGRAGARLQTLVIDEGFGSQDAEGRQRLVEAINLVSPDFAKILVITHLDELKDAFPARIEVQKTERGSIVEVIA
jgi:exonuclease SbcC